MKKYEQKEKRKKMNVDKWVFDLFLFYNRFSNVSSLNTRSFTCAYFIAPMCGHETFDLCVNS